MSESAGEKTFAPSAKRKRDAALKGDVLRSKELSTAAIMLLGAGWLTLAGPWLVDELEGVLRAGFTFDRRELIDFAPGAMLRAGLLVGLPPILTIAVPVILLAIVSQLGFGEGRWVGANLAFKGSRINPLSGLKRMFGPTGWIEMGKGILKVILLGGIAWAWGASWLDTIVSMGRGALAAQLSASWGALTSLLFALAGGLIVIALVDVPVQLMRRNQRLMMTMQDVRDEHKEAEGSPEARAHRRQRQREIAAGGVANAVRQAQFVLANPTHFAVAMAYDPTKASAPYVLAKGRGDKAQAMKELARELGVPVLEYPQLARSVYYTTRENQTIREELYAAIAAVLAFVLSLKRGENRPMPLVEVPVDLRFDAEGQLNADGQAPF
jgi:flagellar biosynthetic protein FlhB